MLHARVVVERLSRAFNQTRIFPAFFLPNCVRERKNIHGTAKRRTRKRSLAKTCVCSLHWHCKTPNKSLVRNGFHPSRRSSFRRISHSDLCLSYFSGKWEESLFYYLVSTFCEGHQPRSTHTTKLTLHVMCTNNCTITFCCCCCGVFLFFFFFLCFLVFFFSPCTPCIDVCQCVGVSWLFLFLFLFFVLVFLLSSFYLFGGARPPVDDGSGGGGGNWSWGDAFAGKLRLVTNK